MQNKTLTKVRKLLAVFIFSSLFISSAHAQMSGTYTVCASGCDFSTINGAVTSLQSNGVNGATTIAISSGTYNENIYIYNISGLSSTNTLTFKGTGSTASAVRITSNSSHTLNLNNVSYVTFENLHLDNSNSYYNYSAYFSNTTHCSIKNCKLSQSYNNYYYYYYAYNFYGNYNDELTIEGNEILGGYYAVYNNNSRNVTVSKNKIMKHTYYGIYGNMNTGNKYISNYIDSALYNNYGIRAEVEHNTEVLNNTINNATYGVLLFSSRGDMKVINNMVNLSVYWGIGLYIYDYGYYYYYNNYYGSPTIKDTCNIAAYHNTLNKKSGYSYSSNPVVYIYIYNYYYYYSSNKAINVDLRNNNITSDNSSLFGLYNYNYYSSSTYMKVTSEGNNYYSPNGFYAYINNGSTNGTYNSLSAFKTAMGSSTDQSVSVTYVGTNDLHLASGSNVPTGANCGVNYDIDGDARGTTTVASGADEAASDQAPIARAKNITVYLDENGEASVSASDIDNGSSDDIAITSSAISQSSFDCSNIGDNSVVLTVTDASNQTSADTSIVTVKDTLAPTASTKNISVTLNSSGMASISASDVDNGSSDNCSIVTYTLDNSSFDCGDVGENTVKLTVTDASGNSSTATATVTVETTLTADAGADKQVYYGYTSMASATLTGSGANGGGTYTYKWSTGATTSSITVNPSSTTTYTLTVTDNNGCTATDDVTVNVEDVRCGNNMDKVIVCHKGSEICIASSGVKAHLDHGCMVGTCKSSKKNGTEPFEVEEDDDIHAGKNNTVLNAYPNPFKNASTVEFTVAKDQQISLALYDVQGRKVQDIFSGNAIGNVLYRYKIDAKELPSDVYFVRLVADDKVQNIKLMLTK